jgi:hypothetical protein
MVETLAAAAIFLVPVVYDRELTSPCCLLPWTGCGEKKDVLSLRKQPNVSNTTSVDKFGISYSLGGIKSDKF